MTKQTAEYILEHSELLIKSDCVIIDDVLYEHCTVDNQLYSTECFRFFISEDDYDYVTDQKLVTLLNNHFNCNAQVAV